MRSGTKITESISDDEVAESYEYLKSLIRKSQIRLIMILVASIFVVIVTTLLSSYVSLPPKMLNIITDRAGATEKVHPILNPRVSDQQAIRWANDVTSQLLSLHFKKYSDQITQRASLFAGNGWEMYQKSLIDNQVVESIVENGLIITAVNSHTPRLVGKTMVKGKVNWYLQIPVFQTITGAAEETVTVKKVVAITVEETRRDEALSGLKVRLFNIIK